MKTGQITAIKLLESMEYYPTLELLTPNGWHEIEHIAKYEIIDGVWLSTGDDVFITAGEYYKFRLMDILTIRYDEDGSGEYIADEKVEPRYFIYKDEPEGYRFEAGDDEVIDDDQDEDLHYDDGDHDDNYNPYFLNSEEIEELIHFKKWLGEL